MRTPQSAWPVSLAMVWCVVLAGLGWPRPDLRAQELAPAERERIWSAHEAYRGAWLANDSAAVMRSLTEDVVIIPHHGLAPVTGAEAVRAFWFPAEGPVTTITKYSMTRDEIEGDTRLVYVRGTFSIEWTQDEQDGKKGYANAGNYLSILRRRNDGTWRIALQMWNDPPNRRVAVHPRTAHDDARGV